MNKFFYALLVVSLFSCKKDPVQQTPENPQNPQNPQNPVAGCKFQSLTEFPAVDGKNSTTTFTYNDQNRVVKLDKTQGGVTTTKTVTYNADNKIDKMTYGNGAYEQFRYTDGRLSEWEAIGEGGTKVKKYTYTYTSGKLTREDRFQFNGESKNYEPAGYVTYDWDGQGNITTIKTYTADTVLQKTSTYTYYADKTNTQKQLAPQLELFFLDWVSDVTAFINSNNLLQTVSSTSRTLNYATNNKGFVTTVKGNNNDNYFTFSYSSCN